MEKEPFIEPHQGKCTIVTCPGAISGGKAKFSI